MEQKFKENDIVRLKSGGPNMTVVGYKIRNTGAIINVIKKRGGMNPASASGEPTQTYPDTNEAPVAVVNSDAGKTPVVDIQSRRRWEAQPGATLRETLEKWAKSDGTEVEWMTPYDYPIKNTFAINQA